MGGLKDFRVLELQQAFEGREEELVLSHRCTWLGTRESAEQIQCVLASGQIQLKSSQTRLSRCSTSAGHADLREVMALYAHHTGNRGFQGLSYKVLEPGFGALVLRTSRGLEMKFQTL